MYFDLNVPIPSPLPPQAQNQAQQSKKNKGKQPATNAPVPVVYSPAQLAKIETRIDLLVRRYTVIALNQIVESKVDPKTHVNILDPLLSVLRKRDGVLLLKRLTIILDGESEKGFGLINANTSLFPSYDLLALHPTTHASFSLACLTHTLPSQLTAHIISLPSASPRLPFNLKHTLVRTAIKNGAVFEINISGAVREGKSASEAEGERRNWWAAGREVVRVTKGKGLLVSGGAESVTEVRSPKDAENLTCLLGLAQNQAHDAISVTPKSLLIRAQTRKTYRAIFSEPKLIMPSKPQRQQEEHADVPNTPNPINSAIPQTTSHVSNGTTTNNTSEREGNTDKAGVSSSKRTGKKRSREDGDDLEAGEGTPSKQPARESSQTSGDNEGVSKPGVPADDEQSGHVDAELGQLAVPKPAQISQSPTTSKPKVNSSHTKEASGSNGANTSSASTAVWTESNSAKKRKKKKAKLAGSNGGE